MKIKKIQYIYISNDLCPCITYDPPTEQDLELVKQQKMLIIVDRIKRLIFFGEDKLVVPIDNAEIGVTGTHQSIIPF